VVERRKDGSIQNLNFFVAAAPPPVHSKTDGGTERPESQGPSDKQTEWQEREWQGEKER